MFLISYIKICYPKNKFNECRCIFFEKSLIKTSYLKKIIYISRNFEFKKMVTTIYFFKIFFFYFVKKMVTKENKGLTTKTIDSS